MRFETQFSLGQHVFRVGRLARSESQTCPVCEGRGRLHVMGADGSEVDPRCPHEKCGGRGSWIVTRYDEFSLIGEAVIGSIEVRAVDTSIAPSYENRSYEERYMLDVTGVGSGTVYPRVDGEWTHTHLFASREQAESFCESENPKLRVATEKAAA